MGAPGEHERRRRELEQTIATARDALAAASDGVSASPETLAAARLTLIEAHAGRAEESRYGAGQLSRGSQRAPTPEACDDGWRRVESIVVAAEASAREAAELADELATYAARRASREAARAARAARQIVDERNHAYTFHADPSFSFGEGWYVAAAALLAGIAVQIEPDQPQTRQVERFIADVGLDERVVPYRPRPRANKQLTEIVASAFRPDPELAQRRVREAFLGPGQPAAAVVDWTAHALADAPAGKKVLLWVRDSAHDPQRNSSSAELRELARRARQAGLVPLLFGDALRDDEPPEEARDLTLCWRAPLFQGIEMRRAQLWLFEQLRRAHELVGQLGVTTAGMDGPALLGLPTLYLTDEPNVRMGQWGGAIPGYREIVRDADYLERISEILRRWSEGRP